MDATSRAGGPARSPKKGDSPCAVAALRMAMVMVMIDMVMTNAHA